MAYPSVTYSFSNSTTADASQVNQNFTDIINGLSDGTKDLSVSAITAAGNVSLNANTTLGNAAGDLITLTGSIASHVNPSAHNTYDFGTVTTLGWRAFYFASSSATKTAKVIGPAISSDITLTLPAITGTLAVYTAPTVQRFTSGSGTYTTPANVKFIRVRMIGGGGGGSGSGTASSSSNGTAGNNSLWKTGDGVTTIVTAGGGAAGTWGGGGSTGGSATINSPALTLAAVTGNSGVGASYLGSGDFRLAGGAGGAGPLGGGVGYQYFGGQGSAAGANTGAGGQGGGGNATTTFYTGQGGGAGAYCEFIITGPSATYLYEVAAAANGGSAGTSGYAGGAGGSGFIIVEEYYG